MPEDLASKLDDLIGIGERIANALEGIEADVAGLAPSVSMLQGDVSMMQGDVATIDLYAHSMKLDMESLVSATHSILIAMP